VSECEQVGVNPRGRSDVSRGGLRSLRTEKAPELLAIDWHCAQVQCRAGQRLFEF